MSQLSNGWFKVPHDITEARIFSDAEALRFWLWCRAKSNWTERWFDGQKVLIGQFVTSRDKGGDALGIDPQAWRRLAVKLEKWGIIKMETTNSRTTITVLWTGLSDEKDTPPRTTDEQRPNNDRTTDEQRPNTTKDGLDGKEELDGADIGAPATPSPTPPTVEPKPKRGRKPMPPFVPPTLEEVREYAKQSRTPFNADKFFDHFSARGWISGRTPLVDWRAALRNWARTERERNPNAWQSQFKMMSEIPGAKPQ